MRFRAGVPTGTSRPEDLRSHRPETSPTSARNAATASSASSAKAARPSSSHLPPAVGTRPRRGDRRPHPRSAPCSTRGVRTDRHAAHPTAPRSRGSDRDADGRRSTHTCSATTIARRRRPPPRRPTLRPRCPPRTRRWVRRAGPRRRTASSLRRWIDGRSPSRVLLMGVGDGGRPTREGRLDLTGRCPCTRRPGPAQPDGRSRDKSGLDPGSFPGLPAPATVGPLGRPYTAGPAAMAAETGSHRPGVGRPTGWRRRDPAQGRRR